MVYEEEVRKPALRRFIEKIGKRNLIIIGVVLLIGVAVWLNWMIFANNDDGYTGYDKSSGMDTSYGVDTNTGADTNANLDSYFASTQINRQRARDEALEVLQSVVENAAADKATRNQALADISKIAKNMEAEANIETLIIAKGFAQCVAVVNGDMATIVVEAENLTPADIAIINEIVYDQTGIKPINITITKK
ncbi:MAG: SpoIIIAH-like family protein [Clostridiales bacterium]|nr:SpoIIIAH-like family protein [Clostridiales bacterium]